MRAHQHQIWRHLSAIVGIEKCISLNRAIVTRGVGVAVPLSNRLYILLVRKYQREVK